MNTYNEIETNTRRPSNEADTFGSDAICGCFVSCGCCMNEYFPHDYHARNDRKLVTVNMKYGLQGIGLYWCLIEMLYECGGYIMRSECERIAFELRLGNDGIATLNTMFDDTDLFKTDGEKVWSNGVLKRLKVRDEKSQKARESAEKRWSTGDDANAMRTHSERNAIKGKERKGKKRKEEERNTDSFALVSAQPPTIQIPCSGSKDIQEFPIYQTQVSEWASLFPGIDVMEELRKCRAWNLANPTRRKTPKGMLRHINTWLSKAQDNSHGTNRQSTSKRNNAPTVESDREYREAFAARRKS